jgi:hypothetical protein
MIAGTNIPKLDIKLIRVIRAEILRPRDPNILEAGTDPVGRFDRADRLDR